MSFWDNPLGSIKNTVEDIGRAVEHAVNAVGHTIQYPSTGLTNFFGEVGDGVNDLLGSILGARTDILVDTYISRLLPDDALPNSIKAGVLTAVLGEKSVGTTLISTLRKSVATRAERAYIFGTSVDYPYGTPYKKLFSGVTAELIVKSTISKTLTSTPQFLYCYAGKPNYYHHAWSTLVQEYGYLTDTNQIGTLSTIKGAPVYLKDITVVLGSTNAKSPIKGSIDQLGVSPTSGATPSRTALSGRPFTLTNIESTVWWDAIHIEYVWIEETQVTIDGVVSVKREEKEEKMFFFCVPGYNTFTSALSYQVCYVYEGKPVYWTYEADSGTYPEIDGAYNNVYDSFGSFFPMLHFRHGGREVHPDKTTPAYLASKKLARHLGIEYDRLSDGIKKNPDVAAIEQAFVTLAVPAITTNIVEQTYLFDFFMTMFITKLNEIPELPGVPNSAYWAALGKPATSHLSSTLSVFSLGLVIRDQLFEMSLGCTEIRKRTKVGAIGGVGFCNSSFGWEAPTIVVTSGSSDDIETRVSMHTYRRQFSATMYDEIEVCGLNLTYKIYNGHNTVASGDHKNLLIPLDYAITQHYNILVREVLYARSLHLVFNSLTRQKIEWYQTTAFQGVMFIVAAVLAIESGGASMAQYQAMYTAGKITLFAIVMGITLSVLKYFFYQEVAKVAVREIGGEAAAIIAIALIARAGYNSYQVGSVAGAPFAKEMLFYSNLINSAVGSVSMEKLEDLRKEAEEFGVTNDIKKKELDAANKALQAHNVASSIVILGERSKDYFDRTIHTGNIGVLSIDCISSYVDIALMLPPSYEIR